MGSSLSLFSGGEVRAVRRRVKKAWQMIILKSHEGAMGAGGRGRKRETDGQREGLSPSLARRIDLQYSLSIAGQLDG